MNAPGSKKRAYDQDPGQDERVDIGTSYDEESTEFKLAILASLVSDTKPEILLETLLLANGSVEDASNILRYGSIESPDEEDQPEEDGLGQTLEEVSSDAMSSRAATFMDIPEDVALPSTPRKPSYRPSKTTSPMKTGSSLYQSSISSFIQGGAGNYSTIMKPLTKKGRTLHLFTPAEIAAHTPCSLVPNFLPAALADNLLRELLAEAPSFGKDTFQLFDQIVTSPHTMAFYVDNLEAIRDQQTSYIYNGTTVRDIRQTPPVMLEVSQRVKDTVNSEIQARINTHYGGQKLKGMLAGAWEPNASFVNCYDGAKESVGYHADQLTYLGPRAVIGSLSLGVAREFRVRRVVPKPPPPPEPASPDPKRPRRADSAADAKKQQDAHADAQGQIAIHLPHNSLLVMHADMQEEWKHAIAPAPRIEPHPVAGARRLNVTYRCYRASFHPRHTPRCRCGVPCVLRSAFKSARNRGRYMWMCHTGYTPGQDDGGCGFFAWAVFDDDGEPPWAWGTQEPARA